METQRENVIRILAYLIVVICCLVIGGFIAIDLIEQPIGKYINFLWKTDAILYIMLIIASYALFLLEYVQRYSAIKNTNILYSGIVQVLLLCVAVFNNLVINDLNKWITVLIIFMSLIGGVFYNKLSETSMSLVRFELVWPSLFTVAVTIYSGYSFMIYGSQQANYFDILYGYVIFIVYTLLMFGSVKRNSKKKNLWYAHLGGIIALLFFALRDKRSVVITLLCVFICAVMTVFEAWDVTFRRTNENRKRYEEGLGVVSCIFLILIIVLLILFDSVSAWYEIAIVLAMIIANFVTFFIEYGNYFMKDTDGIIESEKEKEARRKIDVIKVISYIFLSLLLIIPGILKIIPALQVESSLGLIEFRKIENWSDYDTDISLIVSLFELLIAILAYVKSASEEKKSASEEKKSASEEKKSASGEKENVVEDITKSERTFLNIFQMKNIMLCHAGCCCLGIFICVLLQNIINYTDISMRKIIALKYILLIALNLYILVYFCFCYKKGNGGNGGNGMSEGEIKKKAEENKVETDVSAFVIMKILQMLHFPSCLLLMLLIVVPSMNSNNSFLTSLLMSLPFVLAAMGSFAFNDYYDYEKDKINKPDRILPLGIIKRQTAKKIGICIAYLSCLTAVVVSRTLLELFMYWITAILSMTYSKFIKQISPIKTFYTAAVLSVPFCYATVSWGNMDNIWAYAIGVFLYVTGKEILMDVFDDEGDRKCEMKTISILLGKRVSTIISLLCLIGSFACFFKTYNGMSIFLVIIGLVIAISCYLCWITNVRKLQRIIIYCLWIPLILCTIQGWI